MHLKGDLTPGSISPPEGGWVYSLMPKSSLKEEVPELLGQFFHGIAVKPSLNQDLLPHSQATWMH